jgi:hypothetical protein
MIKQDLNKLKQTTMKNYLIIIPLVLIGLTSCSDVSPKVEIADRANKTTTQLVIDSYNDSVLYRVVIKDDALYAISDEDDLVSYKLNNDSEELIKSSLVNFALILIIIILICIA